MANLQAKYHLNEPLWKQYLLYLGSLLQGDLGASFRYEDWSVNQLVAKALPISAAIGGGSLLIALVVGITLGTLAALRQNSVLDYFAMFIGSVGSAFPSFVIGPLLILVFAIWLKVAPSGGWDNFAPRYDIANGLAGIHQCSHDCAGHARQHDRGAQQQLYSHRAPRACRCVPWYCATP